MYVPILSNVSLGLIWSSLPSAAYISDAHYIIIINSTCCCFELFSCCFRSVILHLVTLQYYGVYVMLEDMHTVRTYFIILYTFYK